MNHGGITYLNVSSDKPAQERIRKVITTLNNSKPDCKQAEGLEAD